MIEKDPFAALKYREFRAFVTAQFFFTLAILIQEVSIGYQLYKMTRDPLSLGWIGLAEAIPYISLALFGGYIADKHDKRTIIYLCFGLFLACALLLVYSFSDFTASWAQNSKLYFIYFNCFLIGVARGFFSPSWSSIKPFLVKKEHYSNSASWAAQFWQSAMILGPITGGLVFAKWGIQTTLWLAFALYIVAFASTFFLKPKQVPPKFTGSVFVALSEGIRFVLANKVMFYAILLDMFSVLFGGVMAILPIFAEDILKVGPEGFGWLRGAPGIGAVLTMFLTAFFPPTYKAWRNMMFAVFGFGVCTLAFAFSTNFYLSLILLFLTGSFDSISVIIRQTILQVLPPDELRGRVSSVNGIFVSCSNELGAFESGVAAKFLGTVPSVIFGGTMTLVIGSIIFYKSRNLLDFQLVKRVE